MIDDKVYLTFPTDKKTAHTLTFLAHGLKTTQPKLINEICQNFIITVLEEMKKDLEQKPE